MKIALCNGGLGNQVFQYIFARYVELASGEECYLDNAAFCGSNVAHNGFEIPTVFPNAKPHLLSDVFTEDVWKYMMEQWQKGKGICEQMRNLGEDITMVAETTDFNFTGNVVYTPANAFIPSITYSTGMIYFHGYWINRNWLKSDFYQILKKELEFAPITEEFNQKYAEAIQSSNSVSVHIRRGDFVTLNRASSPEAYKQAIKIAEEHVEGASYFVFSDDKEWCRNNMDILGLADVSDRVCFVEGNEKVTNFRDMQLMSLCKANILVGGSSFSFLAALLNANDAPIIINGSMREV